jgi:PilZ domain
MASAAPSKRGLKNKRRHQRTAVMWTGRLDCGNRAVNCVLFNVSASGAMLRLDDPDLCPSTARLILPRFGEFRVRNVWRGSDSMGIEFLESPQRVASLFRGTLPEAAA